MCFTVWCCSLCVVVVCCCCCSLLFALVAHANCCLLFLFVGCCLLLVLYLLTQAMVFAVVCSVVAFFGVWCWLKLLAAFVVCFCGLSFKDVVCCLLLL